MWFRFLYQWNVVHIFYEPIYTISSCNVFGLEVLLKLSVFSLFGPVNDDSLSIAFREFYPIGAAAILQGEQWTV